MKNYGLAVYSITVLINRKLKKVIQIYKEQRRLLIKEVAEINTKRSDDDLPIEEKDELYYLKRLYVTDYRQHLILTAFLMCYSYLEEALPQVHGAYAGGKK